jgi:hypothetical protein
MGCTRSQIDAALQELYDRIPDIPGCTGECWRSCGPIDMSVRERQRLRTAGYKITPGMRALQKGPGNFWCEALTANGRCGAYSVRPILCRLWGAVEGMRCPFGCQPVGGWLSDEEATGLILAAYEIGGGMPAGPAVEAWSAMAAAQRSGG